MPVLDAVPVKKFQSNFFKKFLTAISQLKLDVHEGKRQ